MKDYAPPRYRTATHWAAALEQWGVKCNPIPLGLTPGVNKTERMGDILGRLAVNPAIKRMFSGSAPCRDCSRLLRDPEPKAIDGKGLCLKHAWMRSEGLLG